MKNPVFGKIAIALTRVDNDWYEIWECLGPNEWSILKTFEGETAKLDAIKYMAESAEKSL